MDTFLHFVQHLAALWASGSIVADAGLRPDQAGCSSIVEQNEQQIYSGAMEHLQYMALAPCVGTQASMVSDVRAVFIQWCEHSGARIVR